MLCKSCGLWAMTGIGRSLSVLETPYHDPYIFGWSPGVHSQDMYQGCRVIYQGANVSCACNVATELTTMLARQDADRLGRERFRLKSAEDWPWSSNGGARPS